MSTTLDSATNTNRPDTTSPVPLELRLAERHKGVPAGWEIGFGFALILGWVVLFAAGSFIPTAKFRADLLDGWTQEGFGAWVLDWLIVIGCYTVTNILFLALLSACLGCMTCRWRVSAKVDNLMQFYSGLSARRCYLAALLRGFFVYLMIISGLLILGTEETVVNTAFAQYLRVAGITSVFGFMVGYDPRIAYRLMGKVNDIANSPLRASGGRNS
jgi:hypothetical protein